jgi:uncharacterized protein YutE (UPF0331/DUF86 family)
MNDIVVNKVQSIQRCIERAREEYQLAGKAFATNYSRQDAAILNITRACEQAIDLANHVRSKPTNWVFPHQAAESFELLVRKQVISYDLELKLRKEEKGHSLLLFLLSDWFNLSVTALRCRRLRRPGRSAR